MLEECSCGTGTMGWAGTAPWLNHPSNPGSPASGNIFGEEKFPLQENAVQSRMLSAQGGRRGISWGIPAACLCGVPFTASWFPA